MPKAHVFYLNPYGHQHYYEVYDEPDDPAILKLVEESTKEYGSVTNLVVIYGDKMKFVPVKVVQTWEPRVEEPEE